MADGPTYNPNGWKEYPGNLTYHVLVTCIVAAMGGLMFGYDIGISGGVTSMPMFLSKFFPHILRQQNEQSTTTSSKNQFCKFNSLPLTLFTSSLYLAALLSSLVASYVTKEFGRKLSIFAGGILFCAGAFIGTFAQNIAMLITGRLLLGFGIGFANQSVPLYLSEMAPYKYRGAFTIIFQLSVTIGILIGNTLDYFFDKISVYGWRLSVGGAIIPAIIIIIGAIIIPDTPNSLIERGKLDEAMKKLKRIRGLENVDFEFKDIVVASEKSNQAKHPWRNLLLQRKYRPQLIMSIAIPFFQQLSGINVIMFYVPVMFKTIGFKSDNASLLSAGIMGCVNVLATFVSIYGVDKWGRRFLFLEGGVQMFIVIFQVVLAICIGVKFGVSGTEENLPKWYAIVVVIFISIYVCGYAWSWGPLGWLVPSEISPLEIRSAAQSINVSLNMLFTFIISLNFHSMLCHLELGLFLFFGGFVVVMSIFIYYFLPETKGVPIEQMSIVWKKHWFWGRYIPDDELPPAVA